MQWGGRENDDDKKSVHMLFDVDLAGAFFLFIFSRLFSSPIFTVDK